MNEVLTPLDLPAKTTERVLHPRGASINVRRARLSDYPAVAAFIQEGYEELAPFKGRQRWDWQFVDNPFCSSRDERVPVWIAEVSGKVVGQIAVQEGSLQIDGVTHPAGWIVDVMILPSHRGLGLGHRLFAAVAEECPILVTLTMAEATRRMSERLGAVDLGEVKLFSRIVRLDSTTVERYLYARTGNHPRVNAAAKLLCRYAFLHHVLAGAGNLLAWSRNAIAKTPRLRNHIHIVQVDHFDPEIDFLWRRLAADYPVAFARDSKFMNWRFTECPQVKYRHYTASREGNTVGYLVLRRTEAVELPLGVIVDFLAARNDRQTIEALIAFALESFGDQVASVECATSVPEFQEILRHFGFHAIHTERPNCVAADPVLQSRLETSSGDWLFSKADHDWDQIHLA